MILAPRRKWHWGTSSFKPRETKIFPFNFSFFVPSLINKLPLWEHSLAVYVLRSQCKECLHQFLSVLKPPNSRSFQSLKSESKEENWQYSLAYPLVLTHSLAPPHLFNLPLFPIVLSLSPYILSSFQFLRLNSISGEWENEQNKACGGLRIIWNWETESLWRSQLDI